MSANCTLNDPTAQLQQQAAAAAAAAAIEASVNLLILASFLPGLLVPTAAVMFFFSTPELRRRPIFIVNALALVVGLVLGGQLIYTVAVGIIGNPISPGWSIAEASLQLLTPMLVQGILLLRVVAVYPPARLSWIRRILIYGPFAAIKTGRVINGGLFLADLCRAVNSNPLHAGIVAWGLVEVKVEWFLQLADNTYASALFLYRLRGGRVLSGRQDVVYTDGTAAARPRHGMTYAERIKALFWIAAFNLVFPVIFNIVQLVFIFRDPNFVHGTYVLYCNTYLEIIGVLLATIWVSGTNSGSTRLTNAGHPPMPVALPSGDMLSTPEFAPPSTVTSCIELSAVSDGKIKDNSGF
ncbi:hypothetical protein C8Q76DRAFT_630340 [Earliella scabrosa]|nr:hypothetical protein C8Q76DRAFT_630340 [Earliella scabrosa]